MKSDRRPAGKPCRGGRGVAATALPRLARLLVVTVFLGLAPALAAGLVACGGSPGAQDPGPDPSTAASPTRGASPSSSPPAPSPSGEPSASPTPFSSPSRSATPSATVSESPSPATPRPSPSCPADNRVRAWYYIPNDAHRVPEIPADVTRLLRGYGGRYVGDTGDKVVYLTFDAGYENGYTARILDALAAAEVRAAFFVTGGYIRGNPDLVRRMVDEGHVVANHTDSHPSLPSLARDPDAFEQELRATARAFRTATGASMGRFLRPPMGEYSALSLCVTKRLGYTTVFWSFAHRDWLVDDQPPVATTVARILAGSHPGAIYLLHAVSRSNAEALPQAIFGLRARGYRLAPLTELP